MTDEDKASMVTLSPLTELLIDIARAGMNEPKLDPRDPDPSREGIFRYHNCWKCQDGKKACVNGAPSRCEYPHARND